MLLLLMLFGFFKISSLTIQLVYMSFVCWFHILRLLLNSFISFSSFLFVTSLVLPFLPIKSCHLKIETILLISNSSFICLFCPISLARTSRTCWGRNSESGPLSSSQPYRKIFSIFPIEYASCGLMYGLYYLETYSSLLICQELFKNHE